MFSKYITQHKAKLIAIVAAVSMGAVSWSIFSPGAVVTADTHDIPGCASIAMTALNMAVGLEDDDLQYDYDEDGEVTSQDALDLLRIAVGINPIEPHVAQLWEACDEDEEYMASEIGGLVPICVDPALSALSMAVGIDPVDMKYDLNGDGSVTADDALNLLRMASDFIPIPKDVLPLFASQCVFEPTEVTSCEEPAQTALNMAVGLEPVNMQYDVDSDGQVTSDDALNILRVVRGYDVDQNIETRALQLLEGCPLMEAPAEEDPVEAGPSEVDQAPFSNNLFDAPLNMTGWIWSGYNDDTEGVGWISMNRDNCETSTHYNCHSSDYRVVIEEDGYITGHAWSPNIGWITFGGFNESTMPTSGQTVGNARIDTAGNVHGWARAVGGELDASDGWDGWIALSGNNYGISFDLAAGTAQSDSYAWGGGTVVGWMSFEQVVMGPVQASAILTGEDCTIAEGSSSCSVTAQWEMFAADNPNVLRDDSQFTTTVTGSDTQSLTIGESVTYIARDGNNELAELTLEAQCADNLEEYEGACVDTLPDLVIGGSANNPRLSDATNPNLAGVYSTANFRFELQNIGLVATPEGQPIPWTFTVSDYNSGTEVFRRTGSEDTQLQPNDVLTVDNVSFSDLSYGVYRMRAHVDENNEIPELDITNNDTERGLILYPPDPELTLGFMQSPVRSGDSATIVWERTYTYPMECTLRGPALLDGGEEVFAVTFNTGTDTSGTIETGPRTNAAQYQITCREPETADATITGVQEAGTPPPYEQQARLEVLPAFQEI